MRILKFIVNGQQIQKNPACNFSGLVRGSSGYLQAEFSFDQEWDGKVKVAEFRRYTTGDPIPVPVINNTCEVPAEVLTAGLWSVSVCGKRGEYRITTNRCRVEQEV